MGFILTLWGVPPGACRGWRDEFYEFVSSELVLCAGGMYHGDMTEKLKLLYKLHLPHGKVTHVDVVSVTINGGFTFFFLL